MACLPEEIIREILRRLPVKSLLRFRSVSKPWRFLIDSKQFARLHLQNSLITNSNHTLIVDSTQLYYIDLDSFTQLQVGGTPIQPQSVVCACDGLVLLTPSYGNVALWNPSIRKLRNLPEQPPIPDRFVRFEYVQAIFALGYDSKHDDYKVVRVVQAAADGDADTFLTEASIYSLNHDSWKRAKNFPYLLPLYTSRWGIHLNGALHTVAKKGGVIMAFDLGKEEHRELPMPDYRRAGACLNVVSVEVLGGRLAAVVPGKKGMTEIWLMKEYGVKQSWMRLLRFQPPISEPCRDLRPLAYSKSGDEVLLSYDGMCLNWYHLKKKTVTIAYVDGVSASFGAAPSDPNFDAEFCVGSLVSPYSANGKEVQKRSFTRKEINKKRDDFLSSGFKLKL